MEIQTNSKIDFSSHRVTVAWRQSLMKRHENTRLGISDIIGPIESKLDMYDNSFGLMTSTQKSWLKMTATPWWQQEMSCFLHVLHLDVFLLTHCPQPCQTVSNGSQDIDNEGIRLLWLFVKRHVSGVASKFIDSPSHTKLLSLWCWRFNLPQTTFV